MKYYYSFYFRLIFSFASLYLIFAIPYFGFSQNIGINSTGAAPNASAGLDVSFTNKGLLIPRVTLCQRTTAGCAGGMLDGSGNLAAAAKGLLVYQTDGTEGFYYNTSTTITPVWVYLFGSGTGPRWDQILAPTGNLSLLHAGNTTAFTFNSVTASSAFSLTSSSLTTGKVLDLQSTSTTLGNVTLSAENSSNDGFSIRAYNKSTTAASLANFGGRVAAVFAQTDAPNSIGVFANASSASATQSIGIWGYGSGGANSIGVLGIGNAQSYSNLAAGAGGYFLGSQYGIYSSALNSTNGTDFSSSGVNAGIQGRAGSGTAQYHAGVYGFQIGNGNNSGGVIGAFSSATWGGLGYTDGSGTSWGMFTPVNTKIQGFLLVGSPATPQTISSSFKVLLSLDAETSNLGWMVDGCGICDNTSNNWEYLINTANASGGCLLYDPDAQNSRKHLYTPWIWVPVSVTSLYGFVHHEVVGTMELTFDGVSLEYSVNNGITWTQVPVASFTKDAYNGTATGYNQACTGVNSPVLNAWNSAAQRNSEFTLTVTGAQWIRFRFVGTGDEFTDPGGYFRLYSFALSCTTPAFGGGTFAVGNIYAEKNVYAGSNVLQGDLAEYFLVDNYSEPGDLIAITNKNTDSYTISDNAYNPFVIGVHSTNPTVTLNHPEGIPVGLSGRVPVKVSGENGTIKIGDYLTSSSLKGHAMKADKPCYIIGRALDNFEGKGTGKILCLVESGWYNPSSNNNQSGGSFFVKSNENSILVNDLSVKSNSRIFISFRDNAGVHWISNISDGFFTINIEKKSDRIIPFDYFVDNAAIQNSPKNLTSPGIKNNSKDIFDKSIIEETHRAKSVPLPENTAEIPPNIPSDPRNGWVWSPQTGFKMTLDISSMSKEIEDTQKYENEIKLKEEEEKKKETIEKYEPKN